MPESQNPQAGALQAVEASHWWWHDDGYIAQGRVSILAIAEVLIAFYVYYFWLIPNTSRPWVTILSIITVPPLLLRSEKSIQRGLELLKTFNRVNSSSENIDGPKSDARIIFSIGGIVVFVLVLICMDITTHLLSGGTGAMASWITGSLKVIFLLYAFFVALIVVGAFYIGKSDLSEVQEEVERHTLSKRIISIVLGMILLPPLPIALCVLAVGIRIRATVTLPHIKAGIAAFSHNWYETVLVSNIRHAPALLPRAGEVDKMYIVDIAADKGESNVYSKFIVFVYTIFSFLYRWNIKANAWIWFPLAVALRPIAWKRSPHTPTDMPPDSRRKSTAFWSSLPVRVLTGFICTVLIGYFLLPYWPKGGQNQLSEFSPVLAEYLPLKSFGIRYFLLLLLLVALISHFVYATIFRSQNPEVLDKPLMHQDLANNKDQSLEPTFDGEAKFFTRLRLFTFASFLLFVYSVLLNIFIIKWPDTVGTTVWSWVKHWL